MGTLLMAGLLLAAAADEGEPKIQAHGPWPVRHEKPTHLVVRSAEELAVALGVARADARQKRFQDAAVEDTARLLKRKGIDWRKEMLVVVAAGVRNTGGYRVEFQRLTVKDGGLTVHWKLIAPAPGTPVIQAQTYPAGLALVDRFNGRVRFDPPADEK